MGSCGGTQLNSVVGFCRVPAEATTRVRGLDAVNHTKIIDKLVPIKNGGHTFFFFFSQ